MPFKNLILEVIDSFWSTLTIGQKMSSRKWLIWPYKACIDPAFFIQGALIVTYSLAKTVNGDRLYKTYIFTLLSLH